MTCINLRRLGARLGAALALTTVLLSSCGQFPVAGLQMGWYDTGRAVIVDSLPPLPVDEPLPYPLWRGERTFAGVSLTSDTDLTVEVAVTSPVGEKGDTLGVDVVKIHPLGYTMTDTYAEGYRQCASRNHSECDSILVADRLCEPESAVPSVFLDGGVATPVMLRIEIPCDTPPGKYTATVLASAGGCVSELPFTFTVSDHVLPPVSERPFYLDLWQNPYSVARWEGVEPWSDAHFKAMEKVFGPLASMGQKVVTATLIDKPWNGQTEDPFGSMVVKTLSPGRKWSYDYTVFDKWVEFMQGLGITGRINCYSMIPWHNTFDYVDGQTGEVKFLEAAPGTKEYAWYWTSYLEDLAAHLKQKGWFGKTAIAMDERPAESMAAAMDVIRAAVPDMQVALAGSFHEDLEGSISDLCIGFRDDYPEGAVAARRHRGAISTYYTCCAERYPNTFLCSPPAEGWWIPVHAKTIGVDGYLRWAYNSWTKDPIADGRFRTWTGGDCYMVYPKGEWSCRMAALSEGLQLYEKVVLVEDEWRKAGQTDRLEQLSAVLAGFDFDTITKEGAAPAVARLRALLP